MSTNSLYLTRGIKAWESAESSEGKKEQLCLICFVALFRSSNGLLRISGRVFELDINLQLDITAGFWVFFLILCRYGTPGNLVSLFGAILLQAYLIFQKWIS